MSCKAQFPQAVVAICSVIWSGEGAWQLEVFELSSQAHRSFFNLSVNNRGPTA